MIRFLLFYMSHILSEMDKIEFLVKGRKRVHKLQEIDSEIFFFIMKWENPRIFPKKITFTL